MGRRCDANIVSLGVFIPMLILDPDLVFAAVLWIYSLFGGPGAAANLKNPCSQDVQSYCAEAAPGDPLRACLSGHRSELSKGCGAVLELFASPEVCPAELEDKLCGGKTGGAWLLCLKEHLGELPEICREDLRGRIEGFPCFDELVELCPDHLEAGTAQLQCMGAKLSRLSKTCRSLIETAAATRPCLADVAKLCPGKNRDAERACLSAKLPQLSPKCREKVERFAPAEACAPKNALCRRRAALKAAAQACGEDSKKLCRERPGGMGSLLCLHGKQDELSRPCRDAVDSLGGFPCSKEILELCAAKGRKDTLRCLSENQASLSKGCGEELDQTLQSLPCFRDWKQLCSGFRGREAQTCLRRNIKKLSPRCRRRFR